MLHPVVALVPYCFYSDAEGGRLVSLPYMSLERVAVSAWTHFRGMLFVFSALSILRGENGHARSSMLQTSESSLQEVVLQLFNYTIWRTIYNK